MAITTTGYQAPATSRQGLKPSVYDKIILIGPDETPILSLIDTSDVKGIEHSWLTDTLAAQAYDEQIRKNLTREFEINAKNGVNINKDEAYRQHPMIRPDRPSIEQGGLKKDKLTVAREKLASEINVDKLNDEQNVFVGNKDKVTLQGKDLNDLYMLERGSRNAGVKKIMIKHAGIEKTGGLTNEELLGIMDVVRGGRIAEDSFEQFSDRIRYAYDLKENGVKFRVVIDEYNDGKKVFDY